MSDYIQGCLPRATKPGDNPRLKVMGTDGTPPPIDPSEPDVIDAGFIKGIINQAQQGSCCGAMGAGLLRALRGIQGLVDLIFSQASLYGPGNGGRDQGMAIDTCLELLMTQGACTVDVIDQYDWMGFWRGTWPSDWRVKAARFTILEAYDCRSVADMKACYKRGFPVAYGCKGHAVFRIRDNLDVNSWGSGWGNNGLGQWATEREIEQAIPMYGAWGARVAFDPIDDTDLP